MKTKSLLATVIALSLSGGVWAAGTAEKPETGKEPAATTQTQPSGAEQQTERQGGMAGEAAGQATVGTYQFRASNLIGKEIRNPQDEEIGEVDDLIITQDGSIHAVISIGGFLGMGERLVTVPYDELQTGPEDQDYVTLTSGATKEELKNKPEFEYKEGESLGGTMREGQEETPAGTAEGQ